MFLMTRRARTVLDNVRFVKTVLLVTILAFAIDRLDGYAIAKTIAQRLGKFFGRGARIVTFLAIIRELGVRGRYFAGVKKSFLSPAREKKNRQQTAQNCEQTDQKPCPSPRMKPTIITEVTFVTLGDLLLRATGFRHRLNT
jgi:hypothetical protein